MIVVVGSSHDDVLYFEKVLYNRHDEVILNRFNIAIGMVFNQELLVITDQYSSILSSAVMTYILSKYYVDLVIVVGKCSAIDKNTKTGDIVLSSRIIDINADFTLVKNVGISQIPGFNREFKIQNDILGYLRQGVNKRTYVTSYNAVYFSSDNLSEEVRNVLSENRSMFGITDERIVFDHNSSGVALACQLKDVPFVSIKVVENKLEDQENIEAYLNVLDRYIDLGKAVISTIGDIGRNDILKGGVGNEYQGKK